ncbi:MAG: ubiquitin-conjugating enzyme E2 variant, partial [Promethearchaeota archaeon]
ITLSSELQDLIKSSIQELNAYKNWVEGESESVGIIREIAWLVDKNSRLNFEIELLKEHYKNIEYNAVTNTLKVDMKGKMKTQDLTFQFQIDLPIDYPMKVPTVKVLNEFDLEAHEKIKNDLQNSFKDFFDDWTPFSYLVDLFNSVSKKIFEVSVVSCVICHKIECATCSLKIAGSDGDTCHTDCPYCERSYHKHCWEQTIKSFGKCGFCLKTPPPDLMP